MSHNAYLKAGSVHVCKYCYEVRHINLFITKEVAILVSPQLCPQPNYLSLTHIAKLTLNHIINCAVVTFYK